MDVFSEGQCKPEQAYGESPASGIHSAIWVLLPAGTVPVPAPPDSCGDTCSVTRGAQAGALVTNTFYHRQMNGNDS